jgi:hypothetical protein
MPTCPECGAEGVPIVYGMPGPELIAEEKAGRVVLGGCVIEEEDPTWACKGPDQHRWIPEVGSMQVADLLQEALRIGDDYGLTQIRGRHLPDGLMAALVRQTHEYVLAHAAADTPDGWLVYREGIASWWCQAADLTDEEFRRLYMLRADVVKQLTEQGLADRRHPRSTLLYVRCTAA